MQLGQLQKLKPQLDELGYRIVAVSPDLPVKLKQTINKLGLEYELLSDSKMYLAQALGIAFRVNSKTLERYRNGGLDIEKHSGEQQHMLPVPAVFIIGTDSIIKYEYVNPNHAIRPTPEIIMAAAKMTLG